MLIIDLLGLPRIPDRGPDEAEHQAERTLSLEVEILTKTIKPEHTYPCSGMHAIIYLLRNFERASSQDDRNVPRSNLLQGAPLDYDRVA